MRRTRWRYRQLRNCTGGGVILHITAQNLVEFRNFATRPVKGNGLGLTASTAAALARQFETSFPLLDESPAIYPAWRTLVDTLGVIGKQVHDARLVAVCHAHQIEYLLTFNVAHFNRLGVPAPGVVIVDAKNV